MKEDILKFKKNYLKKKTKYQIIHRKSRIGSYNQSSGLLKLNTEKFIKILTSPLCFTKKLKRTINKIFPLTAKRKSILFKNNKKNDKNNQQ